MNCCGYEIPSDFECARHIIKVEIVEHLSNGDFGRFNSVTNTISVAKSVKDGDEYVKLDETQILNTFFHELIHCFQFFFDNSYSEAQAQSLGNLIYEYVTTSKT